MCSPPPLTPWVLCVEIRTAEEGMMRAGRTAGIACPSKLEGKTSTARLELYQA